MTCDCSLHYFIETYQMKTAAFSMFVCIEYVGDTSFRDNFSYCSSFLSYFAAF